MRPSSAPSCRTTYLPDGTRPLRHAVVVAHAGRKQASPATRGRTPYHWVTCTEYGTGATRDKGDLVVATRGRIPVHGAGHVPSRACPSRSVTRTNEAAGWYTVIC